MVAATDLVVTGTTDAVTAVVAVAVADAVPVPTEVTEETPAGTGVPVGANVTTEATDVRVATGEGEEAIMAPEGMVASGTDVAPDVMVEGGTGVGETVGTAWPDAAGGGIRATKRPATANTGTARRLNMRRRGWTTVVAPSRCPKARSLHRTQQFGSGASDHHDGLHAGGSCSCTESTGRNVVGTVAIPLHRPVRLR